jgi:hypothetical protein
MEFNPSAACGNAREAENVSHNILALLVVAVVPAVANAQGVEQLSGEPHAYSAAALRGGALTCSVGIGFKVSGFQSRGASDFETLEL